MKLNLGCGPDRLEGFDNLDRRTGWRFESGLPYTDESVHGITISHALMYVAASDWPSVLADLFRVLMPGGVVRITEDDTESETSARKNDPWPGMVTSTGPHMMARHLRDAGFLVREVGRDETHFSDRSLIQAWRHADPPYFFFIEGIKPEVRSPAHERAGRRAGTQIHNTWLWARRTRIAVWRTALVAADTLIRGNRPNIRRTKA